MNKHRQVLEGVHSMVGEVYLVGGCLRDVHMGLAPKDYDFATPLTPEEVANKARQSGRRVYEVGKSFGTVGFKVPVEDGFEYAEVTTFRKEKYIDGSRKPQVEYVTSLEDDLSRRDFTMNSIALGVDGRVHDPHSGISDIEKGVIRAVGDPDERIAEDPLRMIRAARFSAQLGFSIDEAFLKSARSLPDSIFNVSVERWVQEIDKIVVSDNPTLGFAQLEEMGIMKRILPEVGFILITAKDVDVAWAQLLQGIKCRSMTKRELPYIASGIMSRLKFSKKIQKTFLSLYNSTAK